MKKNEIVFEALKNYSCVNTKQLSMYIKRKYNIDISPSSVGGVLRTFYVKGLVGKSNCGNGSTVYWEA